MTARATVRLYGHWGQHPDHPVELWKAEVEGDETRLGYWAWVEARTAERAEVPPTRPH